MKFLYSALLLPLGVWAAPAEVDERHNTAAGPSENADISPRSAGKFQWQFYKSCTEDNKNQIRQAFDESKWLSDALASWVPTQAFQSAFDAYMGADSSYNGNFLGWWNFRKVIQSDITRQNTLYSGKAIQNSNLYIYCNEDSRWSTGCKHNETHAILAYEEDSSITSNFYITFCPPFYTQYGWLTPLSTILQQIRRGQFNKGVINPLGLAQAGTMLHEMFHMGNIVSQPRTNDLAYGAEDVWNLAKTGGAAKAYNNADSFTFAALAVFAQQQFGLADPPVPAAFYTGGASGQANEVAITHSLTDQVIAIAADEPKPLGVAAAGSFDVDTDYWEVQSFGPYSTLSTQPIPTSTSALPVALTNMPATTYTIPASIANPYATLPDVTQLSDSQPIAPTPAPAPK